MAECSRVPVSKRQTPCPPQPESIFQAILISSRNRFSTSSTNEKQPPPSDTALPANTIPATTENQNKSDPKAKQTSPSEAVFSIQEPILYLTFSGETIVYNLKALDKDPHAIIELLRLTASQCGSWMLVGAYYRRTGNTRAALSVVETMIKVMSQQGLSDDDLKPAYLFLSSCETDLAKRARSSQPDAAEEHYKASKTWLQKVYGKFVPISISPPQVGSNPASSPSRVRTREPSCQRQATSPPEASTHELLLGREINILRREQKEQSVLISETRAVKRKLESEITFEREGRRRILRDFDDLEKELATAQKMENYALGQVKREVEARRKAEDKARVEKAMRLEMQKAFEQSAAAPFSEIANTVNSADAEEWSFGYPAPS